MYVNVRITSKHYDNDKSFLQMLLKAWKEIFIFLGYIPRHTGDLTPLWYIVVGFRAGRFSL
uniref:Bm6329 n=1 Tax=Brugia malayi TaxID=6279 RepID=A0A0H5S9U7_BRUMA|nr:Bm6329 [Brugia malayi]